MTNEKLAENRRIFVCETCNYSCSKNSDYIKHTSTRKHKILTNTNKNSPKLAKLYICECGKTYKHASSLCSHKKKCKYIEESESEDEPQVKYDDEKIERLENSVVQLLNQNNEFKELLVTQNAQMIKMAENAGSHNTTNSHNKNFNLNFFLNETCKDAMSIKDFVKSIVVTVPEFIETGETGFVNGISKIMTDRINNMEIQDRPLHCTDLKRETIYIKDDEKWEKDNDKENLRKAVKQVANKNYYTANDWMNQTPNSKIMGTKEYEDFFKYANESTGGVGVEQTKSFEDKIMRNVMKSTTINKEKAMIV